MLGGGGAKAQYCHLYTCVCVCVCVCVFVLTLKKEEEFFVDSFSSVRRVTSVTLNKNVSLLNIFQFFFTLV